MGTVFKKTATKPSGVTLEDGLNRMPLALPVLLLLVAS